MAVPTTGPYGTPILDNFNRANGDPGANWGSFAGVAKCAIDTNLIVSTGISAMRWLTLPSSANAEIWALTAGNSIANVSLYARSDASGAVGSYVLVSNPTGSTSLRITRWLSGAYSVIGDTNKTFGSSYIALACIDDVIQAWVWGGTTWTCEASVADSGVSAAGYLAIGFPVAGQIGTLDDFGGGEIVLPSPVCCTFTPPLIGTTGLIVTIDATAETDDVGGLTISTYADANCSGTPVQEVGIADVPAGTTLVIDGAKHTATLIDSAGVEYDGVAYLALSETTALTWLETGPLCKPAGCICISTDAPCSGASQTLVSVNTQYRRI